MYAMLGHLSWETLMDIAYIHYFTGHCRIVVFYNFFFINNGILTLFINWTTSIKKNSFKFK